MKGKETGRHRPSSPSNDRLVAALRTASPVQVQNALMRRGDREIAIGLSRMDEENRSFVLKNLATMKAERIREEIRYQKRLKITNDQYERIIELLINAITGIGVARQTRSYIRPKHAKHR